MSPIDKVSSRRVAVPAVGIVRVLFAAAALAWASRGEDLRAEPRFLQPFPGEPRASTSAVLVPGDQRVWFYGGTVRPGDLWAFDLEGDSWIQATWEGEDPIVLSAHGMVYEERRNRLLLYGGNRRPVSIFCNDLIWEFDLATSTWGVVAANPTLGLDRIQLVLHESTDRMWALFGGCEELRSVEAVSRFDLAAAQWEIFDLEPGDPRGRIDHVAAIDRKRDRILVFGGQLASAGGFAPQGAPIAQSKVANGPRREEGAMVWSLDPVSGEWVRLTDGTDRPLQMQAVGSFDSISDLFLVYGGRIETLEAGLPNYHSDEIWAFDPTGNDWIVLSPQGSLTPRRNAAGAYCPCRGELLLIGGRTGESGTLPSREEFAFFAPIERPAEFSWDGAPASERRASGQRWGTLRFPEGSEQVHGFEEGTIRLVNCETEQTLYTASAVNRIGRDAWHVRFESLGPGAEEVQAKGRLILTGRPIGARVNFLARLPKTDAEEGTAQRRETLEPTSGAVAGARATGVEVRREPGGWEIRSSGPLAARASLRIYDVAGRLRFRREGAFQASTAEAITFHWDGKGEDGRPLSKGLYFVRVTAGATSSSAKVFLW